MPKHMGYGEGESYSSKNRMGPKNKMKRGSGYGSGGQASGGGADLKGTPEGSGMGGGYPVIPGKDVKAKGGPNRRGRGIYNGDYSGQKAGDQYLSKKKRTGGPAKNSVKIGGITQHSKDGRNFNKDEVESFKIHKKRLDRM